MQVQMSEKCSLLFPLLNILHYMVTVAIAYDVVGSIYGF